MSLPNITSDVCLLSQESSFYLGEDKIEQINFEMFRNTLKIHILKFINWDLNGFLNVMYTHNSI